MFSSDSFFDLYGQFLNNFPPSTHGVISIVLTILLVLAIYKIIKRQFLYIILLVVLLPASIPILKNVWDQLLQIIKFLLNQGRG